MRRNTDRFLSCVYEESDGDPKVDVDPWDIANDLNFDDDTISDVLDSLLEAGLITEPTTGIVRIAKKGVREVEKALD